MFSIHLNATQLIFKTIQKIIILKKSFCVCVNIHKYTHTQYVPLWQVVIVAFYRTFVLYRTFSICTIVPSVQ